MNTTTIEILKQALSKEINADLFDNNDREKSYQYNISLDEETENEFPYCEIGIKPNYKFVEIEGFYFIENIEILNFVAFDYHGSKLDIDFDLVLELESFLSTKLCEV
jgi:hypothetical protein